MKNFCFVQHDNNMENKQISNIFSIVDCTSLKNRELEHFLKIIRANLQQ